ncbi:MAG: helix-turn-helix domain-containing protein [Nitrospira sp.]
MSIKLLDRGWRFSKAKGGDLLVLLGIADFANDEGIAYPSIPTLARKARLTPRNAQRAIRRLVACGELLIEEGKGPHRTHLYRILLSDNSRPEGRHNVRVTKSQGDICDVERVTFQPPNPLKRTVIKKEIEEDDNLSPSERKHDASQVVELQFEEFWKLYPARGGKKPEKKAALKNFSQLSAEDRQLILVAVKHYAESGRWPKDPHRWLRTAKGDEPWRDWVEPEQPSKPLQNSHGPSLTCTKRVQGLDEHFSHPCGQPASPESRSKEPRCAEHLRTVPQLQQVNHAAH